MIVQVTSAAAAELSELADVAARTFPLACPPSVTAQNIAAFIDENLSEARFAEYLEDPDRLLLIAREDGRMVGYAMLIRGVPDNDDVRRAVTLHPAVEISKLYVLPDSHGAGVSAALMTEAVKQAQDIRDEGCVAWGEPEKSTGPTLLHQARLFHQRHQDVSARRCHRERLRDGASGLTPRRNLTRSGQCQQP